MSDEQPPSRAISVERLPIGEVQIVTNDAPGQPVTLDLQALAGPIKPGVFMFCKQLTGMTPDMAIDVGEHLAAEGRKAKLTAGVATGLQTPD